MFTRQNLSFLPVIYAFLSHISSSEFIAKWSQKFLSCLCYTCCFGAKSSVIIMLKGLGRNFTVAVVYVWSMI